VEPFLLLALDDYLSDPSQDCLARLFDAVNSIDLSAAPKLTRHEKLVMRSSERKDIFAERFTHASQQGWGQAGSVLAPKSVLQHKSTNSNDSYSSFEEGILLRSRDRDRFQDDNKGRRRENHRVKERADIEGTSTAQPLHSQHSPSDSSFSLGGSAVWVGDESGLELGQKEKEDSASLTSLMASSTLVGSSRNRRSTDASSSSSHAHGREQSHRPPNSHQGFDPHKRHGIVKDTHFYHTTVAYKDHQLPIKMPLSTFPEEVGDVRHFSFQSPFLLLN